MIKTLYSTFQRWSAKGSVYIFSDPHFEDADCHLMNKNWITPEEQIKILKKSASTNDTLIILGDIGNPEWMKQIKAHKVLIMGNHDVGACKYKEYFDEIYEGPLFIAEKILLSHEPINGLDFCVNIHGHTHNSVMRPDPFHLCVVADVCNYKPINLDKEIKNGLISKINTIHRETINKAIVRKEKKCREAIKRPRSKPPKRIDL